MTGADVAGVAVLVVGAPETGELSVEGAGDGTLEVLGVGVGACVPGVDVGAGALVEGPGVGVVEGVVSGVVGDSVAEGSGFGVTAAGGITVRGVPDWCDAPPISVAAVLSVVPVPETFDSGWPRTDSTAVMPPSATAAPRTSPAARRNRPEIGSSGMSVVAPAGPAAGPVMIGRVRRSRVPAWRREWT